MGLLDVIKEMNYKCYSSYKHNIDHELFDTSDYVAEKFIRNKTFESDYKSIVIIPAKRKIATSCFGYYLDGSRYTYKVAELATEEGDLLPIIAGQYASGVVKREGKNMVVEQKIHKSCILVHDSFNKLDFMELQSSLDKRKNRLSLIVTLDKYSLDKAKRIRPENSGIAKVNSLMHDLEIKLLNELVNSNKLNESTMLMIDGSLQFAKINTSNLKLFQNVVGVSKSFNPNNRDILKNRRDIGSLLVDLKVGERTPVFRYTSSINKQVIGAWYLRIRPSIRGRLDGVIKIEKIAVTDMDRDDGFASYIIDNISSSLVYERTVAPYGNDSRWHNHLYPIYLAERVLKETMVREEVFLSLF